MTTIQFSTSNGATREGAMDSPRAQTFLSSAKASSGSNPRKIVFPDEIIISGERYRLDKICRGIGGLTKSFVKPRLSGSELLFMSKGFPVAYLSGEDMILVANGKKFIPRPNGTKIRIGGIAYGLDFLVYAVKRHLQLDEPPLVQRNGNEIVLLSENVGVAWIREDGPDCPGGIYGCHCLRLDLGDSFRRHTRKKILPHFEEIANTYVDGSDSCDAELEEFIGGHDHTQEYALPEDRFAIDMPGFRDVMVFYLNGGKQHSFVFPKEWLEYLPTKSPNPKRAPEEVDPEVAFAIQDAIPRRIPKPYRDPLKDFIPPKPVPSAVPTREREPDCTISTRASVSDDFAKLFGQHLAEATNENITEYAKRTQNHSGDSAGKPEFIPGYEFTWFGKIF